MEQLPELKCIVATGPMMTATALLNTNAFPDAVSTEVNACCSRLAYILCAIPRVDQAIQSSRDEFKVHLKRNWLGYRKAVETRPDLRVVLYWDGVEYVSALHSVLYEVRAFLDLYARLIRSLLGDQRVPPTFKSGSSNGKTHYGAKFLRSLEKIEESRFPERDTVCSVIRRNLEEWLQLALDRRDALAHFRELPELRHIWVPVTGAPIEFDDSLLNGPTIGQEESLSNYVEAIGDRLGRAIEATAPLLPSVNRRLLENWDSAKKYLSM